MADKSVSADAPTPENPRIVQAVGTAVTSASGGSNGAAMALAKRLEAAMVAETEACAAEGIIDPDVIRERKLAAYADEKAAIMDLEAASRAE